MMVTNLKDYLTLEPDVYDADFRYGYRDVMTVQFKQYFYNKSFSLQDQGKCIEIDTPQKVNKF